MESNIYNDESSEEVESNDMGVGRSYECVFCKRGFNTAQALGGHMNIHRKDRAKSKPIATSSPSSNNSNKQLASAENNNSIYSTGPRLYQQIPAPPRICDNQSVDRRSFDHQDDRDDPRPMQLSCEKYFPVVSSAKYEDLDKNRQAMDRKEELDLELRLGYES